MEALESLYYQKQIYRAWVLCGTDEECIATSQWLDEHHHTVVSITMDDIEDERLRYVEKIDTFLKTARILVISYPAWNRIREEIEVFVLPEQNLTVFGNLEDDVLSYIHRCLGDAELRGFKSRYSSAEVLYLYPEGENKEENM